MKIIFKHFCNRRAAAAASPVIEAPQEEEVPVVDSNLDPENPDWTYDPNEPRYCICNQVSYGDMVACDNEDVSLYNMIFILSIFAFEI